MKGFGLGLGVGLTKKKKKNGAFVPSPTQSYSSIFNKAIPGGAIANDSGITLGVGVYFTKVGKIYGVRYYIGAGCTSPQTIAVYAIGSGGVPIVQKNVGAGIQSAWNDYMFDTPINTDTTNNYEVCVQLPDNPGGIAYQYVALDYATTKQSADGFVIAPADASTVHGTTWNNGRFSANGGTLAEPTNSFHQNNYCVDVLFQ